MKKSVNWIKNCIGQNNGPLYAYMSKQSSCIYEFTSWFEVKIMLTAIICVLINTT